jgi:hypothetical protein
MEIEDVIILLLSILIVFLIIRKKNENFELMDSDLTTWQLQGYKLMNIPNFYEIFGSNNLDTTFEFPGKNNWKLFTNTKSLEQEGLASLISTNNPPFYNFDDNIRLTGFSKTSAVIGLMTPTKISPSGQWLKGFEWYGVSRLGEDKNAKDIIVWANHKTSTDIKLNNEGLIEDAVKLLQVQIPIDASLSGSIYFEISDYKSFNHPPFTTFYFQILNNWGNNDTVKVGAIVPYFEI